MSEKNLPAVAMAAVPKRRRASLELAKEIERRGYAGIYCASVGDALGLCLALALETAIDAFIAEHGEGGANGGQIFLMSDGKQTVGNDLFDQVDRANQFGIKIHTLTYGNADAATMAQISSTTSGDRRSTSGRAGWRCWTRRTRC